MIYDGLLEAPSCLPISWPSGIDKHFRHVQWINARVSDYGRFLGGIQRGYKWLLRQVLLYVSSAQK